MAAVRTSEFGTALTSCNGLETFENDTTLIKVIFYESGTL